MSEANTRIGTKWRILAILAAAVVASLFVILQGGEPAQAQAGGGEDADERIIGGTDVPNGKYPFMVALLDKRFGNTAYQQQFCGGTLIDKDSVLTAAHCVRGRSASNLRVTVGRTVLDSNQGQVRDVSRIKIHPNYNPNGSDAYDAAVLKLTSEVNGISPIKVSLIQDFYEEPGRNAFVAGWGNTRAQPAGGSNGSSFPQRMREAQVPLVSDDKGKQVYGASYVPALMIAAGKTGKDTCQGDSGGPIFARRASGAVKYTQIGITSFGIGCGARGYPGVYTEVNASSIRNFITNAAR